MIISLIVAASLNRVIGKEGRLPWHLPDDSRYFMRVTQRHHVIMGRKTFESIGSKALPNRTNIIVSHSTAISSATCLFVNNIEAALKLAHQSGETEVFIVGGEQIYRLAMKYATRIYVTKIMDIVDGDTFFPEFSLDEWHETSAIYHAADARHIHSFVFLVYERKTASVVSN